VVNRWNSLDQETVDVGSINSFKSRLDKIRKTNKDGFFYGFCMVRKALGLMEIGPREATQGELQGEYTMAMMACVAKLMNSSNVELSSSNICSSAYDIHQHSN